MNFIIHILQALLFLGLFLCWLADRLEGVDAEACTDGEAVATAPANAGVDGTTIGRDRCEGLDATAVEDLAGACLGGGDDGNAGGAFLREGQEELADDGFARTEGAREVDAGGLAIADGVVEGSVGEQEADAAHGDGDPADVDDLDGNGRGSVGADEAADAKARAAVEEVAQREGGAEEESGDGAEGDGLGAEGRADGANSGEDVVHAAESSTNPDKLSAPDETR